MPATFAEDVACYAEAGWPGMEVWLTKLETHLESHSLAETRQLLDDHHLAIAAASYQGGLLLSQGEQRRAHFDDFKKRLELCQQMRIGTLILAADFVGVAGDGWRVAGAEPASVLPATHHPPPATHFERAVVSLAQAAQWAAAFDVRLALEFRGRNAFCTSLETALALVLQCGEDNVGINLDIFHYYTGPSKFEDLARMPVEKLAFVQVCDLAGVPRELATDADRILPGDGDLSLEPFVHFLRQIHYEGWVSLELLNPTLWRTPTNLLAQTSLSAMQKMLNAQG